MNSQDQIDPILKQLESNARISTAQLAAMCEKTESEAGEMIEAWEKDGTILGYHAVLDPEKAVTGAVRAHIAVSLRPERGGGFDGLAARIARFDEVTDCFLMSGGHDLAVVIEHASLQEVARFVAEKLATIDGVRSTSTSFQLKAYKRNGFLAADGGEDERLPVTP